MAELELRAEARSVLGKKVARLRRAGITPANIFGHNVVSQAIQVATPDLTHLLRATSGTRLLRLKLAHEATPRTVLIRHVSRKPTTDQFLHVDFYQVSMSEKTTLEVPLILVGTAPVAQMGDGIVYQQLATLTIECLPGDIPDHLDVDISSLTEPHSAIHVSDLQLPPQVSTSADPAEILVSVATTVTEEAEAAPLGAEEPAAEQQAPTEPV